MSSIANITAYEGTGTIVQSSRQTRPLWFDGRFLSARDLERDQNCFLLRQAELGTAAGFGVIHGLQVSVPTAAPAAAETIVISPGQGLTPGGYLVTVSQNLKIVFSDLADAENLDVQFGISTFPVPVARTRTGLFVIALRPVEFTANPITTYPVTVQGTRTAQDSNIVEATAVSLIPYPQPLSNFDVSTQQAALARQIFLLGGSGAVSDSLLPIAMVSLDRNVIQWVDQWLVRRDSGPEFGGIRFGLNEPAAQQAYLMQYDAQLQKTVAGLAQQKAPARFAATDYFQALPPAGRFPLASIDTVGLTQLYFPPQTDVTLSLVPDDELPALIDDSLWLPPIDLTQPAGAYADLSLFALVPVPRHGYAALLTKLPPVTLTAALPQVLNNRKPLELLRYFGGPLLPLPVNEWQTAIGTQTYGYYIRRRSAPIYLIFTTIALIAVPNEGTGNFALTASVSPETATGTVMFMDGATTLGSGALTNGSTSLSVTGLATGTHQLTAIYSGDGDFAAVTSAPLEQTV